MYKLKYKGKGEHSVRQLELIIEQQAEELHLLNSGQKQLNMHDVSNRRELLLDFLSEVNGNLITHPHLQMSTGFVEDYLKSNNCC